MKTAKEWVELYSDDDFKKKVYTGDDLGAICDGGGTSIKLWSPVAEKVEINFYKDGELGTRRYWSQPMELDYQTGVWSVYVRESLHGMYYDFAVTIDGVTNLTGDPYARAAGINGARSMVIDMRKVNPEDWWQDKAPAPTAETVIDELHVKEFSWDPRGGWSEEARGKYLAFTHNDTTLDNKGELPTGLTYLKNLGITHVQLMPIYDYGSVDENDDTQFNWGYDPVNYNVPEGSYSSDPHHGEVRVRELKQAIQALHQNGFRVIMDVVYNHTWNLDHAFQKTMPYYYYRTWEDGSLSNGSGCGNDVASERPMVHKYIVDSVLYWAREYHIDGFRFDLMGLLDVDLMNDIRAKLDDKYGKGEKLMYGEPWAADKTATTIDLAHKGNIGKLDTNIGMFCDDTRDLIKGSAGDKKATGFVNGAPRTERRLLDAVKAWRVNGSPIKTPGQIINYVSAHDNQTLWDKLSETTPDETQRMRQYRLAVAIYMTCQGRPFMLSGSTFCRTKDGDDNSHNAPIELNRLDWGAISDNTGLYRYYQGLIELRKMLPGLTDKSGTAHEDIYNEWAAPDMVGYMVDNTDSDDSCTSPWTDLIIVYNRNPNEQEFDLGEDEWERLADDYDTYRWKAPEKFSGKYKVAGTGWVMFGARK